MVSNDNELDDLQELLGIAYDELRRLYPDIHASELTLPQVLRTLIRAGWRPPVPTSAAPMPEAEQGLDDRAVVRRVAAMLVEFGRRYPSREIRNEGEFLLRCSDYDEPIVAPVVQACRLALAAGGLDVPDPGPMLPEATQTAERHIRAAIDRLERAATPREQVQAGVDYAKATYTAPLLVGNADRAARRAAVLRARVAALAASAAITATARNTDNPERHWTLDRAERFETWLLREDPGAVT